MRKLILLLAVLSLSIAKIEAQVQIGDIAGSALNFLTTNPKTANNMKPEERIALNLVANLFRKSAERKHDLEVASQSRDQITYKYGNEGKTVSIVKDLQGNAYLLIGDIVYPISNDLLIQAAQQVQAQYQPPLPPQPPARSYLPEYNRRKLKREYKTSPRTIFLFFEYNDDNGNKRRDFKEFHGVSRNFNKGEVKISITYNTTKKSVVNFKLEIFNFNGERIHSESIKFPKRYYPRTNFWFAVNFVTPGDYRIKVTMTHKNRKGRVRTYYLHDQVRIF